MANEVKVTPAMQLEMDRLREGWVLVHNKGSVSPWHRVAAAGYAVKVNERTADALVRGGFVSSEDGRRYHLAELTNSEERRLAR